MIRKFLFLTCIALGVSFASSAFADAVSDGVAAMPGSVQEVRFSGSWQSGGTNGVYRIVVARAATPAVSTRMFIQWVALGSGGQMTVVNTTEIGELGASGLNVTGFTAQSDAEGLALFLNVIPPGGSFPEEYELFVFGPNEYRFGVATN